MLNKDINFLKKLNIRAVKQKKLTASCDFNSLNVILKLETVKTLVIIVTYFMLWLFNLPFYLFYSETEPSNDLQQNKTFFSQMGTKQMQCVKQAYVLK